MDHSLIPSSDTGSIANNPGLQTTRPQTNPAASHAHRLTGPVSSHPSTGVGASSYAMTQMRGANPNSAATITQPPTIYQHALSALELPLDENSVQIIKVPSGMQLLRSSSQLPFSGAQRSALLRNLLQLQLHFPTQQHVAVPGTSHERLDYDYPKEGVKAQLLVDSSARLHGANIFITEQGRSEQYQLRFLDPDAAVSGPAPSQLQQLAQAGSQAGNSLVPQTRQRSPGLSPQRLAGDTRPNQRVRTGVTTGTATRTSTSTSAAPSNVVQARLTAIHRRIGFTRPEQDRNTAFQQLLAAIPLPTQRSPLSPTGTTVELITGREFSPQEDASWQRQFPNETQAERNNGRYYRVLQQGDPQPLILRESPNMNTCFQQWELCDEMAHTAAAANFFAQLGAAPTPEDLDDGTQYLHVDTATWNSMQPPHTAPNDRDHALMLTNLMGEPVAASQFASLAANEADPLQRMVTVARFSLGAQGETTIPIMDQATLVQALMTTTKSRLILEATLRQQDGSTMTLRQLLRSDKQHGWVALSPAGQWQALPNNQDMVTYLDTTLLNNTQRDRSAPIRLVGMTGPADTTPAAVGRRLRATYYTMAPPQGAASASTSASASADANEAAVQNASIASIVRDEYGFETNNSAIRRLNAEKQRISFNKNDRMLLSDMAAELSNRPSRPRTFDELRLNGRLDKEFEAFLLRKHPEDEKALTRSKKLSDMRVLSRFMANNILKRAYKSPGQETSDLADRLARAQDPNADTAKPSSFAANLIRQLERHMVSVMKDNRPLDNLTDKEFDKAVRSLLDTLYPGMRTKPMKEHTDPFRDRAHIFAKAFHIHTSAPGPVPSLRAASHAEKADPNHPLHRYRHLGGDG